MSQLIDQAARQQALDIQRSFIVQAPAGSGKTELLISRLLALYAAEETRAPEQVLAITFTRKAAAEMLSRLLGLLSAAQQSASVEAWLLILMAGRQDKVDGLLANASAADLKARQFAWAKQVLAKDWQLLSNPSRLQITTIDGYCHLVARQTPLMAQLAPGLAVADDSSDLYDMAARATLAYLDSDELPAVREAIITLLPIVDNDLDRLRRLLVAQLAQRDQWLEGLPHLCVEDMSQALSQLVSAQVMPLLTQLQPLLPRLAQLAGLCAEGLRAYDEQKGKPPRVGVQQWLLTLNDMGMVWQTASLSDQLLCLRAVHWLLMSGETWRKAAGLREDVVGLSKQQKAEKEALAALIEQVSAWPAMATQLLQAVNLPDPVYSDQQRQAIAAIQVVLKQAARSLLLVFAEQRQTDHAQFAQAALTALHPQHGLALSDVVLKVDRQLRHILIDEFQDTNITQWQLLRYLIAEWENQPNTIERLGRTLLLVGDPMQSIYRFRQAEPALFLQAQAQGVHLPDGRHFYLQPLHLATNFRSEEGVITMANALFSAVFPSAAVAEQAAYLGACPYHAAQAIKSSSSTEPLVELWASTAQGWQDLAWSEQQMSLSAHTPLQALSAVDRVVEWIAQQPDDKTASIAILASAKAHLLPFVQALGQRGIAVHGEELVTLADRWYIQDGVTLTRCLLHPGDQTAWLALLRAPWCGLSLASLHQLAAQSSSLLSPDMAFILSDGEDQQRLARLHDILKPILAQRGQQPIADLVRAASLALGLSALLPDEAALADCQAFWRLLRDLERQHSHLTLPLLNAGLEKLFAQSSQPQAAVVAMTIHKSKGLEFDTVILPSLEKRGAKDEQQLFGWLKLAQDGIVQDILAPLSRPASALSGYLQQLNKAKASYEKDRLLYVAVTRAVRKLIMVTDLPANEKGEAKIHPDSLLSRLWRWPAVRLALTSVLSVVEQEPVASSVSVSLPAAPSLRRFQLAQLMAVDEMMMHAVNLLPVTLPAVPIDDDSSLADTVVVNVAAAVGTVTHVWLERIAREGVAVWPSERVRQQSAWLAYQLSGLQVPASAMPAASQQVMQAIHNTLEDSHGQWLLQQWVTGESEWALTSVDESGVLQQHIIDRTFVDEQGVRWIIDYKTSVCPAEQTLDSFVQEQCQRYQPQLQRYRDLLQALTPTQSIQTALFLASLPAGYRWQQVATA